MADEINIVHIYAQPCWHQEAYIVANTGGLQTLRAAIDAALEGQPQAAAKYSESGDVFTSDGEGYHVVVVRLDAPWGTPQGMWLRLAMPYTDDMAKENQDEDPLTIWPAALAAHPAPGDAAHAEPEA